LSTGKLLAKGEGHSKTINDLSFSPDDKQLVSVGEDATIFVWNVFA
jgi:WD40 repeat protein